MTDLKLVMHKPATLQGRVVWNGQPVAGATVTAFRLRGTASALPEEADEATRLEVRRRSRDHVDSTTTGEDGTFTLDRVPPDGAFMLDVTHDGYRSKYIDKVRAGGQPMHIRLDAGVRIAGTVVDKRYRPIHGAMVEVRVNDKPAKSVSTDKRGRFQAGGLDDGPIKIRVKESGLGLLETAWFDVQPGERAIKLQATRGETITGRVADAAGKAVKYINVSAFDEQGKKVAEVWIWANSGKFRLKGLKPGTYRIRVSGQNAPDPVFVEAVAAGTRDLVITVR